MTYHRAKYLSCRHRSILKLEPDVGHRDLCRKLVLRLDGEASFYNDIRQQGHNIQHEYTYIVSFTSFAKSSQVASVANFSATSAFLQLPKNTLPKLPAPNSRENSSSL